VRGTPFVLIHWFIPGGGARFTLVDLDGREIWILDMDEDYASLGFKTTKDLHAFLARNSGILDPDTPGRFSIRSFGENQRITFSVTPGEGDDWSVKEIARVEYAATAQDRNSPLNE